MAYLGFIIAGVFHVLALLFAASMGVSIERGDERDARGALVVAGILFVSGILISIVAGNLLVLGGV